MTWRKFTVLLKGLSRNAVFIIKLSKDLKDNPVSKVDTSDEQAMAILDAMCG